MWLRRCLVLAVVLLLASGCGTPQVAPATPSVAVPVPTTAPAPTSAPPPAPVATVNPTVVPTAASSPAAAGFPVTITDAAGRTVTLAAPPKRIVSIAPSNTEILYALGLGDKVVAVDQYSDFPAAAKAKATLGGYLKPDMELLVAAAPDLVLGTGVHRSAVAQALDEQRIPFVMLEPKTLPEVFDSIVTVGKLTGTQPEADKLAASLRTKSDAVTSKVAGQARPRTYVELSPQLHSTGPGTFLHDLVERAGGSNIAVSAGQPWPQLSQEAIVLADPEVIILNYGPGGETPEQVKARPSWAGLSAVKQGRVVNIDPDLANRPGPRAVDALEQMAATLHPAVVPMRRAA